MITAGGNGPQTAGYLLNRLATAAVGAYSLSDKLRTTATLAYRVRRAADDAEQDIGFTALGVVDTAALTAHCTGDNGYVVTAYDQSGNGRNLTNATEATQPKVYDSAGGVITAGTTNTPASDDDSGGFLARADAWGMSGDAAVTICANVRFDSRAADQIVCAVGAGSGTGYYLLGLPTASDAVGARPANSILTAINAFNVAHTTFTWGYLISAKAASADIGDSTMEHDGAAQTEFSELNPTNNTNISNTAGGWGAFAAGTFATDGRLSTLLVFNAVLPAGDLTLARAWFGARL